MTVDCVLLSSGKREILKNKYSHIHWIKSTDILNSFINKHFVNYLKSYQ